MAEEYQAVFSAQDRISGVMERMARNAGVGFKAIGNAASGTIGVFAAAERSLLKLETQLVKVVGLVGGVGGSVSLLGAMVAVGKTGVDFNVMLQGTSVALTRITGSAGGAAKLIGELRNEARLSALTFAQMLPIAQSLAAVYGPAGIGRIIPTMRAFADTATALRVDSGGLERSLLGFRQLLGRDKPTAEDVNQVAENLPGLDVRGIMKRAFGTADTEELQKAGVTGRQVGEAIILGMQKAFGGSQQALGGTLPVLLSNFQDAFNDFSSAITQRFTPVLTNAVSKLLNVFSAMAQNASLINALATPFDLLGAAISFAADQLPNFVNWLTAILTRENIVNLLANITGWVQAITDKVTGFIATALGKDGFANIWAAFGAAARAGIDLALRAWNGFTAMVIYFVQNRDQLFGPIGDGFNFLKDSLVNFAGGVKGLFDDLLRGVDTTIGAVVTLGAVLEHVLEQMQAFGRNPYMRQNALGGFSMPSGIAQGGGYVGNGGNVFSGLAQRGSQVRGSMFGGGGASAGIGRGVTSPWDQINQFGQGLWNAGVQGSGQGLDALEAEAKRRADAARAGLNKALGPGAPDNLPWQWGRNYNLNPYVPSSVTAVRGPAIPAYPGGMPDITMAPLAPNMPFSEGPDGSFSYPNQKADDIYARQRGAANLNLAIQVNMADLGAVAREVGAAVTQVVMDHLREQQNEQEYGFGF